MPPRDIFYIVIVRVPTTFPFVPLKLKDRSKQRFRSNSMALWNSHASKAPQHKTNRKHTERLPPHRSTVVQNVNELMKWYRLGCGTAAHRVRSAVRANILSGIFAGKSSCKKPLWTVFAAGCPVKSAAGCKPFFLVWGLKKASLPKSKSRIRACFA